ncbi:MAG: hypothetical protein HIU82_05055 [Proteobacteria bacterium]|nr:hypothetical protein [Pseudomonadota bacterium]
MISLRKLLAVPAAGPARAALAGVLLAAALLAGTGALLAGCATSPAALGLTGAQPQPPPSGPADSTLGLPGLPEPGGTQATGFGTPMGTTGPGRYYGSP